jgi:hypothetical protein
MKCASGKRVFLSREDARMALIDAHTRYEYGQGKAPVNVYECDECGHFHLTSKGEMDTNLAAHLAEGKISREKTANLWINKMNKRR